MDSKIYEMVLEKHVHEMIRDLTTTENVCNVMRGVIIKELLLVKEKIFSEYGEGFAQSHAFLLALDSFKTIELAKFSLILSMTRLSGKTQAIKSLRVPEEILLFDGGEKLAQILQELFNEDATRYLAITLNIKSDLFNDIKNTHAKEKES